MIDFKNKILKALRLNIFSQISIILFICGFGANSGGLYISLYHGANGPWMVTGLSLFLIIVLFIYAVLIKENYTLFNLIIVSVTGMIMFPLIFFSADGVQSCFPIFMFLIPISYGISLSMRQSALMSLLNLAEYVAIIIIDWLINGNAFGWCSLQSFTIAFSITYLAIYGLAALMSSTAITTINKLEMLYKIDELTQVYNRRAFDNDLELYSGVCKVAIFDIDNFKNVNDTFTHKEGDKVLVKFADILKKRACEEFRIYRWGGEEFAVLSMLNEPLTLKNISDIFDDVRKELVDPAGNVITVSCGLYYKKNVTKPVDPVKMADTFLYEAKNSGKNKLVYNGESLFNQLDSSV